MELVQEITESELFAYSRSGVQPNLAKGEAPLYTCAQCHEPVFVVEEIVYKPCGHVDAAVLANMSAIVRGQAEVK